MKLADSCILITGASGGIGGAMAQELAGKGASLVLVGRDQTKLDTARTDIESCGGRAWTVSSDLSLPQEPERIAYKAIALAGRIDILVNCAGALNFDLFAEESANDIAQLITLNVVAPMQLANALLPPMIERGRGRIVNVGSIFGSIGFPCFTSYSASKYALRGFSEALRRELAGSGVGVTYVAPRYTRTAFNQGAVAQMAQAMKMKQDDPEMVAARIVTAIERDRKDCYLGWPEKLFVRLNALLPQLVDAALGRQAEQMRTFATRHTSAIPEHTLS